MFTISVGTKLGGGWLVADGVGSLIFGILLFLITLINPLLGVVALSYVIGFYALLAGTNLILLPLDLRSAGKSVEQALKI